ncbi:NrdH-redoxin [Candidatus Gottesmanbacteria bacterium]|nr:NrdH-redoxin [Candidatus Gottesmanbacteria bacterium]
MIDARESGIIVYWRPLCADCNRSKAVLDGYGVIYSAVNILEDRTAQVAMMEVNGGVESVPTIVFPDGSVLIEPSDKALGAKLQELEFMSAAASDFIGLTPDS